MLRTFSFLLPSLIRGGIFLLHAKHIYFMKTDKFTTIITVLLGAVLWCGCSGEESPVGPEFNYGEKDSINLCVNFRVSGATAQPVVMTGIKEPNDTELSGIKTRAQINDRIVGDVNIYVADGTGKVVHQGHYTSQVDMGFEVYDNMEYTVYAIANAGKKITARSLEEIMGLEYVIDDISSICTTQGGVLMSGHSEPQILKGNGNITIFLTRCVAKINLKADYSGLYDDVKITVNKVQLRNAPAVMSIFEENRITSSANAINGEIVYRPSVVELSKGVEFWQFENLQGTLQPENTLQQEKQWPQGSRYAGICSYLELQASYSSPRKVGEILYRFYLGKDMVGNYDVTRNTQMNITVNFTKDGAVDENTWRVDNSEIQDLVTEIELNPSHLTFTELGETKAIVATIYPATAFNKDVEWQTSNALIAKVDAYGNVTSVGNGECKVTACSTDGSGVSAECGIKVNYTETPPPPVKVEVTSVDVIPGSLEIIVGQSRSLTATVYPENATEKGILWSSTDNSIATVDSNGKVTGTGAGECTIYASSSSKPEIKGECAVTVTAPAPDAVLEFEEKSIEMYDGQKYTIRFVAAAADVSKISAISSNPSVVKVTGITADGVQIEALAAGSATISAANNGKVETTCAVTVEKLRIVPASDKVVMYNHFYEDIGYSIYPAWAAGEFDVEMESDGSVVCGYGGVPNRAIPQYGASTALPANGTITIRLSGREDVTAQVNYTVKPMLALVEQLKINANMGNTDAVKDLGLDMHPRAQVEFSWTPADGRKYYGAPAAGDVVISAEEGKIIFPIPNSSNGLYQLAAKVVGDDGYGASGESDAKKFCDITIYETIYLVGISKTINREKVAGKQHTWKYENEIVAKWLSHPNSLMYPQGTVALDLPFTYKGVTYTDSHTGVTEEFTFTFEMGEQLNMALDSESETYNGTAPKYYLEYFMLQPSGNGYVEGNPATGEPYLYIYSRNFASGFSDNTSPDWDKIFEIVYP